MLWAAVLIVTFALVCLVYLSDEGSPLDALPGPPRFPLIGCVPFFVRLTPRAMFLKLRENVQKYGDRYCVKILRRRILHVNSPDDVELVLSHSKNIQKSQPYRFLEPWLGTGLLLSKGSKWLRRRKILTPTFHFHVLKSFVSVFQEKSRDLVARLVETQGTEVNLHPIISDFTLFSICETAMGTQLDSDKSAGTVAYKAAILEIGALLMRRLTRVWLHSDIIFNNSAIGKKFAKVLHQVRSFADKVILERKTNRHTVTMEETGSVEAKRRLAMLDLLLEAEDRGEIDLEGIREEVNTFMFEGHDTTATAITFSLMLLADHEEVQEKVYEECQSVLGDRQPSMADLSDLKYVEAVIKETLRLYPSVPFIARLITEEFMLGDLRIKVGSEIAVNIFDLHHRRDLYEEPDAYRPDRFLSVSRTHEPDQPDGGRTHPYAFVPFSAGPRNCIGQRFAMLEMKCVLAEICRSFILKPRERGWRPALIADMVLRTTDPIYVTFTKR